MQMAVTRTTKTYNPAVSVDTSIKDQLLYRVTVRGANDGQFNLVDGASGQTIWSNTAAPKQRTPELVYEMTWPQPTASVPVQTRHTMGFQFFRVREIKYEVILNHLVGPP